MGGAGSRIAFAALAIAAASGCDSKAKASDPQAIRAEARSKEYESCGASMHCADELRCFGNVCRRTTRSAVGDYYAALGASLRGKNEIDAAIDAYNKALGHYDSEKIALPPDVDCAYGAALAAGKDTKEHAELAARVLHRCMLAVPVGSSLRTAALAELANLSDAGLDPLALGRTQLADVYLTGEAARPSTDKLQITVTANPPVEKKTFPMVTERLQQPDMKTALIACWDAYNAAAKKDAMSVTVGLKWTYTPSEYDDEAGRFSGRLEAATGAVGPEGAAEQCVRAAVEPAIKALNTVRDTFTTKLTITVK